MGWPCLGERGGERELLVVRLVTAVVCVQGDELLDAGGDAPRKLGDIVVGGRGKLGEGERAGLELVEHAVGQKAVIVGTESQHTCKLLPFTGYADVAIVKI